MGRRGDSLHRSRVNRFPI